MISEETTPLRYEASAVLKFVEQSLLKSKVEPSAAEATFDAMVQEAGVRVIRGRLDLAEPLSMSKSRITGMTLEGGVTLDGQMFIDASYEGDLMAAAGVSFVTDRESNAEFGEAHNGITGPLKGNQLPDGIDPYVIEGDASSGLLPFVESLHVVVAGFQLPLPACSAFDVLVSQYRFVSMSMNVWGDAWFR